MIHLKRTLQIWFTGAQEASTDKGGDNRRGFCRIAFENLFFGVESSIQSTNENGRNKNLLVLISQRNVTPL